MILNKYMTEKKYFAMFLFLALFGVFNVILDS